MPDDHGSPPPPEPVRLQRMHETGRRARLKTETPADRAALVNLANDVASIPDVLRALVRPGTGSLIIETLGPVAPVLEELVTRGIAQIMAPPRQPPVRQVIQLSLLRADMGVKARTGDALDLRTAIALALLAGALLQLTRGRISGPATTLAVGALTLLDRSPDRS